MCYGASDLIENFLHQCVFILRLERHQAILLLFGSVDADVAGAVLGVVGKCDDGVACLLILKGKQHLTVHFTLTLLHDHITGTHIVDDVHIKILLKMVLGYDHSIHPFEKKAF